uniref:Glutathione S-transferase n=1 Tax=Bos mutus grunniens TaxID=30521 RepID=A0A8B9Y5V5_BOSMU
MAGKPKLHYFDARGRMEAIRWLLAAAGVEFEEKFIEKPEDLDKLKNDGSLMFQQVPMVEIDGMKLVQTRAILNYIATKYNLYGKDMKERALIDMYSEGVADLGEMIMHFPLCPPAEKDAKLTLIREKTTNRYLPAFENVLKSHGQDYLVGNKLSRADIHLVELLYYVEELDPRLLANFPLLKVSSPMALGARHTPTWHLLSGSWDWGARVPIPVQALLPPSLLSSLQGPGPECGKNLSSQGHRRWTLPHGKRPAFYQERDPGLALSWSLFHLSLCPHFLFAPLCPACVPLSLSLSEWVSPISLLPFNSCSFSHTLISLSPFLFLRADWL